MTLKSPSYEYSAQEKHELLHEMSRYEIDQAAGERQLLAILASGDRSGDIARITAPTLVIHGEDDPLLPLAAGKEVADLIPKSEFISLPRMGHDLPRSISKQSRGQSPLTFGRRKPNLGLFLSGRSSSRRILRILWRIRCFLSMLK